MSKIKVSLLASSLLLAAWPLATSWAADVPAGVKLAEKQVLNVGLGDNVPTLDPQKMQDTVSARVGFDLYEGLLGEDETGKIVPGVASSYTVSPDQLVYTFHIRKNARFSDGSPITADDVVFSYRRLVDPKVASTYSGFINMVKNAQEIVDGKMPPDTLAVKAIDPHTVEITLTQPTPFFTKIAAFQNLAIVKKQNVNQYGDQFTQPGKLVSSGAYMLTYWKVGDHITVVRNPHYWNNKKTVINTVNFYFVSDVNSEQQMYQTGQLDFTYDISSDKFKELKKTMGSQVHANPYLGTYYLDFNIKNPPFKDNPKLRQALSMVIDRDVIVKNLTGRGEKAAYDIVPYGTENYTQQKYSWESLPYAERVKEAKKLYQEAGYSEQNPLTISYKYNTNVLHKKIAVALASMWKKALGVNLTLTNEEWKVFLTERNNGNFQIARDAWVADYNDPTSFLNLSISDNAQNAPGYKSAIFDDLMEQAAKEQDTGKRQKLLEKASLTMMNDYPIAPIYAYVTTHLVKPYVGGYTGKNALDHVYSKNFYIKAH